MMRDDGFSLIEMVVALGLFALVSLAGLGLVETTLRAERVTTRRLDALADADRALAVVARDLEGLQPPLAGTPLTLIFGGRSDHVAYRSSDGSTVRLHDGEVLTLLETAQARWRYLGPRGWQDRWPGPLPPRAVTIEFAVPGRGQVRRLFDLPGPP